MKSRCSCRTLRGSRCPFPGIAQVEKRPVCRLHLRILLGRPGRSGKEIRFYDQGLFGSGVGR